MRFLPICSEWEIAGGEVAQKVAQLKPLTRDTNGLQRAEHPMTKALILTLFTSVSLFAADPVKWTVESGGNGHFYQAFYAASGITWQQASNAASALSGYLATPTNAAENDFCFSLVSSDDNFWFIDGSGNGIGPWLGGFQPDGSPEPAGGWQWVTGEVFSFTNWAPLEPNNNLVNENRIELFGYQKLKDKTWNDYPDTPSAGKPSPLGYIVEWDSLPPIMSIQVSEVSVCWNSVSNATYRLEYSTNLFSNTWIVLSNCIPSSGDQTCIYDKVLPGNAQKFYRVVMTNCVPGP
jgi:hypothetical protein